MNSARTALRERVAALAQARRAIAAGRLDDAERVLQDELSGWPRNRDAQSLLDEVARLRGVEVAAPVTDEHVDTAAPGPSGIEAWSGFEARVRDRKVTRLVERARTALEAGAITDALAAVEEIEAIAPGHPLAADLSLPDGARPPDQPPRPAILAETRDVAPIAPEAPQVVEPETPVIPARRKSEPELADLSLDAGDLRIERTEFSILGNTHESEVTVRVPFRERATRAAGVVMLAASVLALSGWAGYRWLGPPSTATTAVRPASAAGPTPNKGAEVPPREARQRDLPIGTGGLTPGARAAAPPIAPRPLPARQDEGPRSPTPVDPPPTTRPIERPEEVPAVREEAASSLPTVSGVGDPPGSEAPVTDSNQPDETLPADADAMRGLIEGYLAGYNSLDAGGVHSVWPAVDSRALSRAFARLAAQHLVFSRCEVRGGGDSGRAFCVGRATWRPRDGGSERTERRVWRFDFDQRGGRWAIGAVEIER